MPKTQAETMPVRWQWFAHGHDVTADMYGEADADAAHAWDGAHGDGLALSVAQTPRGLWRIESSNGPIKVSWYAKRFATPRAALAFVGERWNVTFTDAVCRCGTESECD